MSAPYAAFTFTEQTLNLKINCSIELQIQEECFWKHMFLSFLFLMILSHILRELSSVGVLILSRLHAIFFLSYRIACHRVINDNLLTLLS